MDMTERRSISGVWYLLGGLAVGAAAGLLFAPKKGSQTREDIEQLRRRGRRGAKLLFSRIRGVVPQIAKTAGNSHRSRQYQHS